MTDELMTAFDNSLNALAAGEALPAILARYPAQAAELRPMLEAAEAARQLGAEAAVPPTAQNRSRAQLLTRAAELRGRGPARRFLGLAALKTWAAANRALAVSLAFVLGFVLGTYGVVNVSAQSLPGEPLYPIKRTVEQTQLLLALDPRAREELATTFNERRVTEVESLLAGARQAQVTFGGLLEAQAGERWTVAGIEVIVPGSTEVIGTPFPGLYVEVEGLSQANGTVVATRVQVTGRDFIGRVLSLGPTTWQIDDTVVVVNAQTTFSGAPALGDWVQVTARRQTDGTWLALHIAREPGGPTGLATATPVVPSPPAVPPATHTAAVATVALPTAAPTLSPTHTPQPSGGAGPAPSATSDDDGGDDDGDDGGDDNSGGSGPSPSNTPEPGDDDGGDDAGSGETRDWEGTLEAVNGATWVIAGQAVTVDGSTEVRDSPQVGDSVRVRAVQQADGTWLAQRIEKRD